MFFLCIGSQLLKTSDKKLYLNKIELQFLRVLNMYEKYSKSKERWSKRFFVPFWGYIETKSRRLLFLNIKVALYENCTPVQVLFIFKPLSVI